MARLDDIILKVDYYNTKINEIYTDIVGKINDCIAELERIKTDAADKSKIWFETKTAKITGKINKCVGDFKKKIEKIINDAKEWCKTTAINIQKSIIKSTSAKIGVNMDDKAAEAIATPIAEATVNTAISSIKIPELQIPQLLYL